MKVLKTYIVFLFSSAPPVDFGRPFFLNVVQMLQTSIKKSFAPIPLTAQRLLQCKDTSRNGRRMSTTIETDIPFYVDLISSRTPGRVCYNILLCNIYYTFSFVILCQF